MPMEKWPLLDSNTDWLGGRPRIDGTRLGKVWVHKYCAGSDSDAHVKMFQEGWHYVTAKQIKQAIAYERKRGESEMGLARDFEYRIGQSRKLQ